MARYLEHDETNGTFKNHHDKGSVTNNMGFYG
jgi:hypothetical protein